MGRQLPCGWGKDSAVNQTGVTSLHRDPDSINLEAHDSLSTSSSNPEHRVWSSSQVSPEMAPRQNTNKSDLVEASRRIGAARI